MRAAWSIEEQLVRLDLTLDRFDPIVGRGPGTMVLHLLSDHAQFHLPVEIEEPHPDLTALAAFSVAAPWIQRELTMDRPVSPTLARLFWDELQLDVGPVDDSLPARTPGKCGPILSYSGGYDSIAVGELLPEDTPYIHLMRTKHPRIPNRATNVRSGTIAELVRRAGERGRNVQIVKSDLEYLALPYPTLPHWLGIAIGSLLLADRFGANSLGLGGTLETFYMDMGRKWHGRPPPGLEPFGEAIGLPFLRPALGMTEVQTMRVAMTSDIGDLGRSCIYGDLKGPCYRCPKCLRKELVAASAMGQPVPSGLKAVLTPDHMGLQAFKQPPPYYMQAQLEYALARLDVEDTPLSDLKARLAPDVGKTAWMERYYEPALVEGVTDDLREGIATDVGSRIGFMTPRDIAVATSWVR